MSEEIKPEFINLNNLAKLLDTSRSSARRWMREAGIHPVAISNGPKGAIRFRLSEIQTWIDNLPEVD